MHDYLQELNESQKRAVIHTDGPSMIIAGAGSGKTRVLTYRIAHLLKQGTNPSSVLALTFTNKAAREMKDRISQLMGEHISRYLWMGTFHSIFSRILRTEHEAIGYISNYTIYDSADSKNLIKTIIKDSQLDDKTYKPGVVASRISMAKNNLLTPAMYSKNTDIRQFDKSIRMPRINDIYKEYSKRCFLSGAMDFDDLLLKTDILLKSQPEILENYQNRFSYILVDEYQDTNFAQYSILKRLAAKHNNICVVGDDAQSIYSFRGARIENIFNFRNDYPGHKIFKLEKNYRSTQNIVNAANSVIKKNKNQIHKKIYSDEETGSLIKIISALTDNEEGFLIANEITESQLRNHFKNEEYAILYRTNAQSRVFEESLRKRNIPYKIYGGLSFYQRKEIKDLLAYFRIIVNPSDNEALKRIINYPSRGIGVTTLSKLENLAIQNEISIWQIIQLLSDNNSFTFNKGTISKIIKFKQTIEQFSELTFEKEAYETASTIAIETGILKDLHNDRSPEGLSRYENIQELLNAIQEFSISAKELGNPDKLANYMEEVSLLTDMDNEKPEDKDKVTLMTVHSAKGLEFKNVFIVGLEENLFPSGQIGKEHTIKNMEEERRLFYVALTRAKMNVYISYAKQRYKWGKLEFCTPSRFIQEINPKYIDLDTNNQILNNSYFSGSNLTQKQSKQNYTTKQQNLLNRNFVTIKKRINFSQEYIGDEPEKIQPGMNVEHQRFGQGKVLSVEGDVPNKKATVFFQSTGQKQLLLKFAKLKIIKS